MIRAMSKKILSLYQDHTIDRKRIKPTRSHPSTTPPHKTAYAILIVIGVFCRVFPHPANLSPLLALTLLSTTYLNRRLAMGLLLSTLFASDVLLCWLYHYPLWGSFSLFTYSGLIATALYGQRFLQGQAPLAIKQLVIILGGNSGFWLWTNFGTWLTTQMYPHTLSGLINCYQMAIPFLQRSSLATIFWVLVIQLGALCLKKYRLPGQTSSQIPGQIPGQPPGQQHIANKIG